MLPLASGADSGTRSFIGVPSASLSLPPYQPETGATLLYRDHFEGERLNSIFEQKGSLEFYTTGHSLRVPVRTLKRNPKSGTLICGKEFDLATHRARLTVSQTIPSQNPDLASALMFFPSDATFDKNGTPETFIRYFKRSQFELIEMRTPYTDGPRLLFARNNRVDSGDPRHCSFEIDPKTLRVIVNAETLCTLKNPCPEIKKAKCGLFVSTKGYSMSGGNMVFDDFILEQLLPIPEKGSLKYLSGPDLVDSVPTPSEINIPATDQSGQPPEPSNP